MEIKSWLLTVKTSEKENKIATRFPQNDASSLPLFPNAHIILGNVTEILIQVWQAVLSLIHHAKVWLLTLCALCLKKEAAEMFEQDL